MLCFYCVKNTLLLKPTILIFIFYLKYNNKSSYVVYSKGIFYFLFDDDSILQLLLVVAGL